MGMYSAITYDHIYWFNVTNYHNKSPKLGVAGQIQVKHLQEFLLASTSYKQSDEMVEIVRLWSHEVFLLTNFQENTEWRRYVNTTVVVTTLTLHHSFFQVVQDIRLS